MHWGQSPRDVRPRRTGDTRMASSPSSVQAADAVKQRAECLGLLGIWSQI